MDAGSRGGRRGRRRLYSKGGGVLEDPSQMPMLEGLSNPPITLQLLLQTTLVVNSNVIPLLHFVTILGEGVTGDGERFTNRVRQVLDSRLTNSWVTELGIGNRAPVVRYAKKIYPSTFARGQCSSHVESYCR